MEGVFPGYSLIEWMAPHRKHRDTTVYVMGTWGQDRIWQRMCVCEWTKLVSKQGNNQADWLGSVLKGWMEWDEDFVVSSE